MSGLASSRVLAAWPQRRRVLVFGAAMCLVTPLFGFAVSPPAMAAVCLVTGLALALVLIGAFALAETETPVSSLSTVMTVMGTCVVVGVAAGSSAAGSLIDTVSPSAALLLPASGGLVAFVFAAVRAVAYRSGRPRLSP